MPKAEDTFTLSGMRVTIIAEPISDQMSKIQPADFEELAATVSQIKAAAPEMLQSTDEGGRDELYAEPDEVVQLPETVAAIRRIERTDGGYHHELKLSGPDDSTFIAIEESDYTHLRQVLGGTQNL